LGEEIELVLFATILLEIGEEAPVAGEVDEFARTLFCPFDYGNGEKAGKDHGLRDGIDVHNKWGGAANFEKYRRFFVKRANFLVVTKAQCVYIVFIMKAHNARQAMKGFALIATISVLLLLTLVAVAFLSLASLTVKTSRFEWAQEEARANARLGLMIALGEIQRDLGPDQRIAVSASILDTDPDSLQVDGVKNRHWMGVISSIYDQNSNGSPYTRDMDEGGVKDARNGTDFRAREQIFNYFVSGNEGGRDKLSGFREYQDARIETLEERDPKVEQIVSRGSVQSPDDFVRVKKVTTEKQQLTPDGQTEYRPKGAYAYWVSADNQKAHIGRPDAHRNTAIDHNSGLGMWRMLHPQDAEPFVIDGIEKGQDSRDFRVLTPKTFTLVSESNRAGVLENFHAMTGLSSSVICNVRDGGLKRNLSAFLHGDDGGKAPEIKDLQDSSKVHYIGVSPEDRLIGPPNERYALLRDESYDDSQYQDIAPNFELLWNWANLANEFRFGESSTGIREQKIWNGAPFRNGGANVYDGENLKPADPRNLTDIKMTPVIVEAATYYNLATYPEGTGAEQSHVLRQCIYPRIGLWNPYNVEMRLDKPMLMQLFLNGKKSIELDGNANFTREIYYGGRRDSFDNQFGGQVYFKLPAVTIPAGETFIFSMGGPPRELDIRNFGSNILQAEEAPSSASYLYKDYRLRTISGERATYAKDADSVNSEFMPVAPSTFREKPLNFGTHGADNYMFMLKYLKNNPDPNISSFRSEPMLVYASVALQAGGGDEYPLEWNVDSGANVVPLTGVGDHVDEGIPPHPFTRDGFRVRWLDETLSNKGANNELFLQEAALGNWNLRASYICRTPFDNVTSRAPYFHGIYTRDNPSEELSWNALSPVLRGGFQTGFPFGPAGFGVDSVVAFEVPTREVGIPSLGYLRHLQLSEYVWQPSYAIGASIADPRVPRTGTVPTEIPGTNHGWSSQGYGTSYWSRLFSDLVFYLAEDNHLIFDMSYEVNHNLWSDFFLTGATPGQIANFAQDPVRSPLKNGNLRLWDRNGDPSEDLTDFFRAAGRLMMDGGFDVHSTNKEAWKALLATTRDTGYGSRDRTPFPRTLFPKGQENVKAEYSTKVFTGFRSLGDKEIDSFAEAIVREVKIRAPFFGLSDFVNRRLADDETGRNGALEAALEKSLPNRGQNTKFPVIREPLPNQGRLVAQGSPSQADLTPSDQLLKPASTGYGTPGYITQGDILQVIGSGLVARSDTFTVRSYGESKDVNGKVLARAWCEAVVQRTPEPVVPDDITGMNPKDPQENQTDFGRRFRIVSFRWLSADEV
jgi:type II secretory pathway pseudopilin PulG